METTNKSAEIAEQIAENLSSKDRRKKEGLCLDCGEKLPGAWTKIRCKQCLEKHAKKNAQRVERLKEQGCCVRCGAKLPNKEWEKNICAQCLEKQALYTAKSKSKKKTFPQPTETSLSLLGMFSLTLMSNTQEETMDSNDQHEHESEQTVVLAEAPEEADKQEATPVSISEQEGYHRCLPDEAPLIKLKKVGALYKRLDKIQQNINEVSNRLLKLSKEKDEVMASMSKLEAERKEVQDSIIVNLIIK